MRDRREGPNRLGPASVKIGATLMKPHPALTRPYGVYGALLAERCRPASGIGNWEPGDHPSLRLGASSFAAASTAVAVARREGCCRQCPISDAVDTCAASSPQWQTFVPRVVRRHAFR